MIIEETASPQAKLDRKGIWLRPAVQPRGGLGAFAPGAGLCMGKAIEDGTMQRARAFLRADENACCIGFFSSGRKAPSGSDGCKGRTQGTKSW